MIKKGYVFILFFALFIAVSRTFMYRYFVKKDFSEMNLYRTLSQGLILFLIFLIPGLLIVRWYYRMKQKKKANVIKPGFCSWLQNLHGRCGRY